MQTPTNSLVVNGINVFAQHTEPLANFYDEVVQYSESLNDRLDFPPTKILERYLRNDLGVALELSCKIDGRTSRFSAMVTHEPVVHFVRDRNCACGNTEQGVSVLVRNIEFVEDGKRVADRFTGVVRLKHFDENQGSRIGNSLYMSFVSGASRFVRWPHFKHGKFDLCWLGKSIPIRTELPNNMVKDGTQMMENLPSEDAEAQRNDALAMVRHCLERSVLIVMSPEWVLATIKESIDFPVQITDVLVGPY